jgi:pyrrolidone-carboxylate peptidase
LATDLPLAELQQRLREAGFNVAVSTDAGRYVCNWTYYRSLQASREVEREVGVKGAVRCYSLFVHVPSEDVLGIEEQRRFAWLLLKVIDQLLTRA